MTCSQAWQWQINDHIAQDNVDSSVQLADLPQMLSSSLPAPPLASNMTPLSLHDKCQVCLLYDDILHDMEKELISMAVQLA